MELIEISDNQKQEYNHFVKQNETGSFLQGWEWGEWQAALGRTVSRLMIKDESGKAVGVIQLIKMPLPMGRYYLYAPYGPVFAGGENFQFPISNFQFQLQKQFPEAVFIRIEPKQQVSMSASKHVSKSSNIQPGKTLVIDLSKSEEELLKEMHNKTRYNIKLAQKHEVEIQDEFSINVGHGIFFEEAIKLIVDTSKRQKFNTFAPDYYKKMADYFTLNEKEGIKLHIYKAVFQNQLLSVAFMVDFGHADPAQRGLNPAQRGGTRTFLFGGSSEFHKNVMAPYLLHFQAMKDAKALGLTSYDFWGIETSSGETPGFVRFKLGFAPQSDLGSARGEKEYGGAYDIVINKFMYRFYKLARWINKFTR